MVVLGAAGRCFGSFGVASFVIAVGDGNDFWRRLSHSSSVLIPLLLLVGQRRSVVYGNGRCSAASCAVFRRRPLVVGVGNVIVILVLLDPLLDR